MKRLISLIMASLFASFSNLSPVLPKQEVFVEDNYYSVSSTEEPDYKKLYGMYFSSTAAVTDECSSITFDPSNMDNMGTALSGQGSSRFWVLPDSEYPTDHVFKTTLGQEIIAPEECIISTSPYSCQTGDDETCFLEVTIANSFKLVFSNLKCWYCCANRAEPESGAYVHTGDFPPKGALIEKGKVLGIATDFTEMEIYKNDGGQWNTATMAEFFE